MIMAQQTNKYINSTGTLPHTGDKASGLLTGGPAREKERGREKKKGTHIRLTKQKKYMIKPIPLGFMKAKRKRIGE